MSAVLTCWCGLRFFCVHIVNRSKTSKIICPESCHEGSKPYLNLARMAETLTSSFFLNRCDNVCIFFTGSLLCSMVNTVFSKISKIWLFSLLILLTYMVIFFNIRPWPASWFSNNIYLFTTIKISIENAISIPIKQLIFPIK